MLPDNMPTTCVVGGCSNERNLQEGIALRYDTILCGRSTQIEKTQEEMGRLREVKTLEAEAIQDFGDLFKAF